MIFWLAGAVAHGQAPLHLQRSVEATPEVSMALSTETAHYQAIFGAGDAQAEVPHGVTRYGRLTIDPQGSSRAGAFAGEELVYYVLEGTGRLGYAGRQVPIAAEDFFYLPAGVDHRLVNPREAPLRVMVMGFRVSGTPGPPTPRLQIANASDVAPQVLGSHGATVHYQLLLGGTDSQRDRIAAGRRVTSLYIMDFSPGGTNREHRHRNGEEIYYLLQGHGEMVAGDPEGEARRYPTEAGDAFFFAADSPVGFFSGTEKGEPHARILAIRSIYKEEE